MTKISQRIAVTGAAGKIAYSLLFRIASGDLFGKNQPIILQLLDINNKIIQQALQGIIMEINDCAFPLLTKVTAYNDPIMAFKDVDIAFLVGAYPRKQGMERKDLLKSNAQIFVTQGRALNAVASPDVKVLVVGNPANTNAYITMKSAPDLSIKNFTSMLRLDHNRALSQIANKINKPIFLIEKLCVWGNHSSTMYADYRFATINGKLIKNLINDHVWNKNVFLPAVAKRGEEIIAIRGFSSAASAAKAAIDHMHDWILGTDNKWTTMGVPSDGSYGIPENIVFGFPVITANGKYKIVQNLDIDIFSQKCINASLTELLKEYEDIKYLLN